MRDRTGNKEETWITPSRLRSNPPRYQLFLSTMLNSSSCALIPWSYSEASTKRKIEVAMSKYVVTCGIGVF